MTDARGSEPTRGRRLAANNVIAVYPSMEAARAAITALERRGVEAGNIELLGPGTGGADVPWTNLEQREADLGTVAAVSKRSLTGIALGLMVGALVGALLGWLAHELLDVGDTLRSVVAGSAIGGAAFGAFGGFFYGGASGLPVSDAWGDTFQTTEGGRTSVAVHSDDAGQVERAEEALRSTEPLRLSRYGADGTVGPQTA